MPARRRLVLLALLLALGAGGAALALLGSRRGGPVAALVVTPDPIDFGDVPWLDTATRVIEVRNRSERVLLLRDPKPSCSCLAVSRTFRTVRLLPGQRTDFEIVLLTTKGEPGKLHKSFTIESDDPVTPKLDVPVVGAIVDFRSVSPKEVYLGDVDAGAPPVRKTVAVRGGSGFSVRVVDAKSSDARITVATQPAEGGTDVVVALAPGAAKGPIGAQVRLSLEVKGADGEPKHYVDSVVVRGTVK